MEPGPIRRLYGVEQNNDCDIAFYASDKWRLPAHSEVIKHSNVVFRAMLSSEFTYRSEEGTGLIRIDVEDVEGRALDNLLRCLYGYPVPVHSIETALLTLYAGHKYQCPELVNLCISFITVHLKPTNVLMVLKYAKVLAVDYETATNVPEVTSVTKPKRNRKGRQRRPVPSPLPARRKRRPFDRHYVADELTASAPLLTSDLDTIEAACSDLLRNCLAFVDVHAPKILESDDLDELDLDTLTMVLSRDTLNVSDELKVFEALDRWAEQQCKQQQLSLTVGSKRKVLKESIFLSRYLTMTLKAWQNGPLKSGIFASEEIAIIEGILTGKVALSQVTSKEAPLLYASMNPRRPVNPQSDLTKAKLVCVGDSTAPRRRRLSIFCRFFHFQSVKCCKKPGSQDSSPFSSAPASPLHAPTPPLAQSPNAAGPRRESQTARINFLEQVIVCFACLFD